MFPLGRRPVIWSCGWWWVTIVPTLRPLSTSCNPTGDQAPVWLDCCSHSSGRMELSWLFVLLGGVQKVKTDCLERTLKRTRHTVDVIADPQSCPTESRSPFWFSSNGSWCVYIAQKLRTSDLLGMSGNCMWGWMFSDVPARSQSWQGSEDMAWIVEVATWC